MANVGGQGASGSASGRAAPAPVLQCRLRKVLSKSDVSRPNFELNKEYAQELSGLPHGHILDLTDPSGENFQFEYRLRPCGDPVPGRGWEKYQQKNRLKIGDTLILTVDILEGQKRFSFDVERRHDARYVYTLSSASLRP